MEGAVAEGIQKSISGPMAKIIALVVIVAAAFGWVLTDRKSVV